MFVVARVFLAVFLFIAFPAYASGPPPLEAYGDLPAVEDMAISPDGKNFAFVARINGDRMLVVAERGGGIRMTGALHDLKVHDVSWAGNDIVMVGTSSTIKLGFGFTTDKYESYRTILLYPDTKKIDTVFDRDPGIDNDIVGRHGMRSVGGKLLGFFEGIELKRSSGSGAQYYFDNSRHTLFSVELATNKAHRVARSAGEGTSRDWLIGSDGDVAATLDLNRSTGRWTIENGAQKTLAGGVDPEGDIGFVSLGKTPQTLIYSTEDTETGKVRWFEVPLAGGEPQEVFADIGVSRLFTSRLDGTLLGYEDDSGASLKPVFFDPQRQATVDKLYQAFADYDMTFVDWTPDFRNFIVLTSGNGDSGTYFLVDVDKLKADPIGYERPAIYADQVGPISTVAYKAGDGLELDGILTLPPGREAKNLPVIMFPHGGPQGEDKATFDWWAQAFASRGYAVLQPNFRGSTNRDDAFRRAGYGEWGRKMQTDLSDGLAELVKRGIADPKRACIMGASYGGYAALAGVTLQQGLYRCAVAVAPVSDLDLQYNDLMQATNRNKMLRRNLLESMGPSKGFDDVSPRRFADRADAPILLIHGKDDTVVEYHHSTSMASALKNAGKPYEMVTLEGGDHWLSTAENRKKMLAESMRFIQKYNPAD